MSKNTKLLLGTIVFIVLLILCGFLWYFEGTQPVRNSHPQRFFTIKGYVAPGIRHYVYLEWHATYTSSKAVCDIASAKHPLILHARRRLIDFVARLQSNGDFVVKVPYDYFKAGRCGWQLDRLDDDSRLFGKPWGVMSNVFRPCGTSASCNRWGGSVARHYRTHAHYRFICGAYSCRVTDNSYDFSETGYYLPRDPRFVFFETFNTHK